METAELKKIWNILAENKLIDKNLAKENIMQIISKKGSGIIHKMIKKAKFDYYIFLFGIILIPLFLLIGLLYIPPPFPNMQSYIGLSVVELFFIYMLIASIRNRKILKTSFNNESIKDSIQKVNSHLKLYLKNYFLISLLFGYIFLIFALIQFIVRIGGVSHFSFSTSGFHLFATYFSIAIIVLMIIWPLLIKIETKIRYSGIIKDINQLLNELNEEE